LIELHKITDAGQGLVVTRFTSIFLMFSKVKFYKHKPCLGYLKTGATMDSNQHEINFSKINKYVN